MKRIICVILSTVLLFSLSSVSASQQGRIYINDVSASEGDTITVSVMTEYTESCCGGSFNIVYDNSLLELNSCTKGTAMEGITPYINTAYTENTLRITWMSSNTVRDGSICDIEFRVKDTADLSAYIKIEELKLSDINGESIQASTKDGCVIIGKGSLTVTDVSLFDFENNRINFLTAGSNKIRTEIHNTLSVDVKPLIIYALSKDNKPVSVSIKSSENTIGKNETVTIENIINVPVANECKLTVVVWDGVLNIRSVKNISFASE